MTEYLQNPLRIIAGVLALPFLIGVAYMAFCVLLMLALWASHEIENFMVRRRLERGRKR